MFTQDRINICDRDAVVIATGTETDMLEAASYDVISDADCYIYVSKTVNKAKAVTSANGYLLVSKSTINLGIQNGERIGVNGANLRIHRVG